jgi:hypothetical protein
MNIDEDDASAVYELVFLFLYRERSDQISLWRTSHIGITARYVYLKVSTIL